MGETKLTREGAWEICRLWRMIREAQRVEPGLCASIGLFPWAFSIFAGWLRG